MTKPIGHWSLGFGHCYFILARMDEDFDKPRDVEADLIEITSRLGKPDSTHRTNSGSVAWRLVLGVLIVLAGAALHYVMWSGTVPWPNAGRARDIKFWGILLAAMFIGPGVGIALIFFAVRSLRMWVLAYPTGLFVWHRGKVVAFPWDELRAIQITGLPDKAKLHWPEAVDGPGGACWYDLSGAGRRLFGTTVTLTRADGEQLGLPSTLGEFAELGRRIQEETYRRLFPVAWADFQAGQPVAFGPIHCGLGGVTVGTSTLPWAQVDSLERAQDKLEVKRTEKKKVWKKVELNEVFNLHVLMGIADAARRPPESPGPNGPGL
jgi:hypothetical protein